MASQISAVETSIWLSDIISSTATNPQRVADIFRTSTAALVSASDQQAIEAALVAKKEELNLYKEIKWTKITAAYHTKYIEFIRRYFDFVASGA